MRTLILFLFSTFFAIALSGQSKGGLLGMETDGDIVVLNTAKSMQVFHPLILQIDLHSIGKNYQIDLHAQYQTAFSSPAVVSPGAPSAIPHYTEDELFYYVTRFDPSLVRNLSIDQAGLLSYDIIAVSEDHQAVLEVVFVVKGENYPPADQLKTAKDKSLRFARDRNYEFPKLLSYPEGVF